MAPKSKAKSGVRGANVKGGRRPPVKVQRGRELPIMPIALAAVLAVLTIAVIVIIIQSNRSTTTGAPTAGNVPCDSLEHTQIHYHAALQIVYNGLVVNLPDYTGINVDSSGNVTCYYWLHVHASDHNVIHIESPASDTFTLGQFFDVWTSWARQNDKTIPQFDATHFATFTLTPDQKLVVYYDLSDGKGPQLFTGDLKSIVLKAHEVITVEITPPQVTPPSFSFSSGE